MIFHKGLWQQLEKLDPIETAHRAKCQYTSKADPQHYSITMLNQEYRVTPIEREILRWTDQDGEPADFIEQLCLLAYLIHAHDIPPADKLVRAQDLRGGDFFFRGIHDLPVNKLATAFGTDPERLYNQIPRFNAIKRDYGDCAIQLTILPRIPITIVIWGLDDEFDARASILFDQNTAEQIPLDALGAAVQLTVDALIDV